jgi:hypothetical protein
MYIGGVDCLYRIKSYKGQYVEDKRQGNGIITYPNGDTLEGHYENGQPHGTMVQTFVQTGRVRMAKFVRGERVEWVQIKHK